MEKVLKKIGIVALAWLLAIPAFSQTVVTNTNANGAGSLADAINNAAAGSTITFNIGTGPFVINTTLPQITKSLTIDATTQPGWTAGTPVVILRGNGGGNGFDVRTSNVTIRGFIVQNYTNGYYQNGGSGNVVEGCWFGLDATGTTSSGISGYGVLIEGGGVVSIGSKTYFGLSTRNVISGCGLGGVEFNNAGTGCYLGNTFVGTDVSGTISNGTLGNGSGLLQTEFRHGVLIVSTPGVTVRNNVISGNRSGGIDISGSSQGVVIAGNKIGTDSAGVLPLGNKTFGVRIKGSNGHTIGGTAVADRNIISANGSDAYPHEQNTIKPDHFDWYNSCGVYLLNCNTSTIQNNYIGVDATGNKHTSSSAYDMGNFYVGIKIEGTSGSNKVIGNVVGGNGFRSSVAAANANPVILFFDGHGMIIKDNGTKNTSVTGNYVGVGADGNSKVGNMQDGISLQGCSSTVVGGPTPSERNIIGDNTWGIFIATNYWDSQALNNKIYGNYIGTNVSGTAAIGNGTRTGLTSGGGVGIIHYSQGTLIGGATAGQGNVISGNRVGIAIGGASPSNPDSNYPLKGDVGKASTGAKVYGNLIGLAADGTTTLKNSTNGIYIAQGANLNEIGGGSTGQGNKIIGNDSTGILCSASINNTIKGNTISNNGKDGIRMFSASTGNTIGGATATAASEGNVISNNIGNGISISGATSNNNAIRRNQISCNSLRGIELNGTGNNNYAKPTFSGSPTALVITGPANSIIELYKLDGCNDCSGSTKNKLQGKTFVTSLTSGSTYTGGAQGEIYVATATSSTNPFNTSEFSDCYSLCTTPTTNLPVKGDTVCSGSPGHVTVSNAQNISYQAYILTTKVGNPVTGSNGVAVLTIPAANLVTGNNTIIIKATPAGVGCTEVPLDNTANIRVNTPPATNSDVLSNGPICAGAQGTLTVVTPENGKTYQVIEGTSTPVSNAVTSNGTANLLLNLFTLPVGSHQLKIKVGVQGCASDTLKKGVTFVVNPGLNSGLQLQYDPDICKGESPITITILNSQSGVTYQAFDKKTNAALSGTVTGDGSSKPVTLNALTADTTVVYFKASISGAGCNGINLSNTATIYLDSPVDKDQPVTATSPICSGDVSVVSIQNSDDRKTYSVYDKGKVVGGPKKGNGGLLTIDVPNLAAGNHVLSIFVSVPGCVSDSLNKKPNVFVNTVPDSSLAVGTNGPVCDGNKAVFFILGSQLNKKYQIFHNSDAVSQIATGNGGTLNIDLNDLDTGTYVLHAVATAEGCAKSVTLKQTATLVINSVPKLTTDAIVNGPVCAGTPAVVTIIKPEKGKSYRVFYNGQPVSDSTFAPGGDSLKITVRTGTIPEGVRELAVLVSVRGCTSDTLNKRPALTINGTLTTDVQEVSAVTSPICINTDGAVLITKIQPKVTYQAYIGTDTASVKLTGAGPNLTLPILAAKLKKGWNLITVKASVAGCGVQNLLDTAGIKVNPNPNLDLAISVAPNVICKGGESILTIASSQPEVIYQAQLPDGTKVGNEAIGNGGSVDLRLTGLPVGDHVISVIARIGGCPAGPLDSTVNVKVNGGATTDYDVTGSTVCKGEAGSVTISGSEIGVNYFVVIKSTRKVVSDTMVGTGQAIIIPVEISNNPVDTVQVQVDVKGCTPIFLDKSALIKTNDNTTSKGLPTKGSTACASEPFATATIIGAKDGITYTAYKKADNSQLASNVGKGSDVVINIPTNLLASGSNEIYFIATVDGCDPVRLDSNAFVYIIGGSVSIKGKGLVCYNTEGTYSIDKIPGVSIYEWEVTGDAVIVSGDSTNSIVVRFGQQRSTISMAPVGSIGSCKLTDSKIDVDVEPPYDGELTIKGPDVLCLNDISRIWADSVGELGVDRIDWTWSGGIDMIDTLAKKSVFSLYDVKFVQTGVQTITATPHITCKDSLGKPDTLLVKVFGYPVAEANSYDPIADFSKLVPLNGTGSSLNGVPPADTLIYSWTAKDKRLEIYNPNSLNGANFKPVEIETWVYLTITNRGICPAKDSALISGKPVIDIPNVFSPNNDGTHDYWEIKNLNALYPNVTVEVFNKWGSQVFKSTGYSKPWDGTRNGEELPVATYYYIVDLKNGDKPYVKDVTIIR